MSMAAEQPDDRPDEPLALRTALALLARGLWPVPITAPDDVRDWVHNPGKQPAHGKGWGRVRYTPESLRVFWLAYPTAGVGIKLGKPGGVIDIEIDDMATGPATLIDLMGGEEVATLGWSAARGGHNIFTWDDRLGRYKPLYEHDPRFPGLGLRFGPSEPDPDKAKQFQSVCPPSLTTVEKDGKVYAGAPRRWNGNREVAALPEAFFAVMDRILADPEPAPKPETNHRGKASPHNDVRLRYGLAAMERELASLEATSEGGRNDQLNKAAFALGQLVAAGCLGASEVESALLDVGRRIGLSEGEVRATLRSGIEDGKAEPRDLSGLGQRFSRTKPRDNGNVSDHGEDTDDSDADGSSLPPLALTCLMDIQPTPIKWLCPGMIPLGKLIILAGEGGLGKSTITLYLASCVTRGLPAFGCQGPVVEPSSVLMIACEDDVADTTVPRLLAADADLGLIFKVDGIRGREGKLAPFNLLHYDLLERSLTEKPDCRLVIIDPVGAFVGRSGVNDHRNSELSALLGPLSELAARRRVTVLLVAHLNKGVTTRAVHRVMGGVAYVNTARAAFVVVRDQDQPEQRVLAPLKFNLGPEPKSLAYRLRSLNPEEYELVLGRQEFAALPDDQRLAIGQQLAKVEWLGEIETTADECFAAEKQVGREPAELNKAVALLREVVSTFPIRAPDVFRAAEARDISEKTLKRAKAKEGILSYQLEGQRGWWWSYPQKDAEGQGDTGPEYQNTTRPEQHNDGPLPDFDQGYTETPF